MLWSEYTWQASATIYEAILQQPFINELAAGTLGAERFARYIAQDELYLGQYGRQMFQLADRIDNAEEKAFFRLFAQSGLDGEKAMHQLLIERFGIAEAPRPSAVTAAYNVHTEQAVAAATPPEALAAMMPCMWIYNRVGLHILSVAKLEGNPYREWIEEYGNEEFTAGVAEVVAMADRWAEAATDEVRQSMTRLFVEAARYEYAFWDYGYNGEGKDYAYMF